MGAMKNKAEKSSSNDEGVRLPRRLLAEAMEQKYQDAK